MEPLPALRPEARRPAPRCAAAARRRGPVPALRAHNPQRGSPLRRRGLLAAAALPAAHYIEPNILDAGRNACTAPGSLDNR